MSGLRVSSNLKFATRASLAKAIEWFQNSGIQEASGGVSRYHLLAENRNLPVSTEITGYAVSALAWAGALDEAGRAADFLCDTAWLPDLQAMPFEVGDPPPPSYFFDCGIIVRGLLAAGRPAMAREIGLAMGRDFWSDTGDLHPVLDLPSKRPRPYEPRWSREPGCFQLKSALAWKDLAAHFPGDPFEEWWQRALARAIATHWSYLPGNEGELKVMDRLHSYCYFLEALTKVHSPILKEGIDRVAALLRQLAPRFERSDVCGQLLRVRLLAGSSGVVPLDIAAAEEEAVRCASHQRFGGPAMENGGYGFGTRDGVQLPFMNPVSTAFCMQAMAWWSDWCDGRFRGTIDELI
ncbi:MAG: hypothetical protein FJW30_21835 [Acidobacteria bacterium]|nr:hypothetical protein [Acidobacteriota bacterium]